MDVIVKVNFKDVLRQFRLENDTKLTHIKNTNAYAENNLLRAEALGNEWHKVLLSREDILSVVLPWHTCCGGANELVPKCGLTVRQVVEKYLTWQEPYYAKKNPICFNKIQRFKSAAFSTIFISKQALDTEDYLELTTKTGLIHLDGLHRMIAWGVYGRLTENTFIESYVAGSLLQAEYSSN